MHKPFTYALLFAAVLGLAACDKKDEDKTQAPPAPASELQPNAADPATGTPPSPPASETDMPQSSMPAPVAPATTPDEQPEEGQ